MISSRSLGPRKPVGICLGLIACLTGLCGAADEPPTAPAAPAHRWGVIFQGLPGDPAHARQFRTVTSQLRSWLIESLEFPADQVVSLPEVPAVEAEQVAPLTAAGIQTTLVNLAAKLQPEDTLWVFTVGHGSHDGRRAWFHVAGRDPSDVDLADWLAELRCREQVLWLTHSSSGWLVKPLSRPGRIVIAATAADDEPNETEFPHALLTVVRQPPATLARPGDEGLSVAALYAATVREVERRFQRDQRVPTEHAQLDDNGDGVGSETLVEPSSSPPTTGPLPRGDGDWARSLKIPDRRLVPPPAHTTP
jgi:hypothetical protein